MFFVKKNKNVFFLLGLCLFTTGLHAILSNEARSKGFIYLDEVDPTIRISPRYASSENFVGTSVDGYTIQDHIVLTKVAADALKQVQDAVKKDGYSLVVYDAYRPQRAVDHFMRWSKDTRDQAKKTQYYPSVNKADVFELGYVAERSGHSRGSTVDLTLIKDNDSLHDLVVKARKLENGETIEFLDDGTIDMGASFDLFDEASWYESKQIDPTCKAMRAYLRIMMKKHGFRSSEQEWWHFTLNNEPYPAGQDSSYFNFPIE
jgi:D-alanyl-D-alanine dipeptidase